jgi:hypothetical protein
MSGIADGDRAKLAAGLLKATLSPVGTIEARELMDLGASRT